MATAITMPALGQTSDELRLLSWYKAEGDEITEGEPLFEAETDKTTLEVEAAVSGTLLRVLCKTGESVIAGTVLAWVGVPGEQLPPSAAPGEQPPISTSAAPAPARALDSGPESRKLLATPGARVLARERRIDLAELTGSGPGGRIERRDVIAAVSLIDTPELDEEVPRQRRVIAERLVRAAAIPQFALERTIDARHALQRADKGLTLTHLLLQAVAAGLRESPRVNRLWVDEGPRFKQLLRYDVGLAIAGEDSLVVATIAEPDRLTPAELLATVRRTVEEGRTGRLPAAMCGPAAVTVSNLGMFGVDRFQAIVDPDQTAILAVGRIATRPVIDEDGILAVPQVDLTLSVDHRTVDGAEAARFLSNVCRHLEA